MKGSKHSYLMVALVLVGGALLFSGVAGSGVLLLWPLACAGMMLAMLWGMRGTGKPAEHTHADGVTHSPDEDLARSRR